MLKRCISLFIILSTARLVLSETISGTEGISTNVVIQTDSIDGCTYQYNFLKAQYGTLDHCVDFSSGVTVCGFAGNNDAANLYNHNQGIAMGLGVQDFDSSAITTTSFVQLTGVGALDSVSLQFQYMGDVTMEFKVHIYGSNVEGVCNPPVYNDVRDSTWLGSGTSTDFITLQPSYKTFKYLCANAQEDSALVLLSQIRFDCPDTSVSPTLSPTTCHVHYYFLKLGELGQCVNSFGPPPGVSLCAYADNGEAVTLFSNNYGDDELEAGMGVTTNLHPDTDKYITPGYFIQICDLQYLDDVNLMMHSVTSDEKFAWYGIRPNNPAIVPDNYILHQGNAQDNGCYIFPGDEVYSYKDFACISIKATSGHVLLSMIRYACSTPTSNPSSSPAIGSFLPTRVPTVKPTLPTRVPTKAPTILPSKSSIKPSFCPSYFVSYAPTKPSLIPTSPPSPCHIQYYFAKLSIPTVGGNTVCQALYSPDVTVCGFDLTGKPINLYSTYQDDIEELQQGLGFQNPDYVVGQTSRYVEITSNSYLSIEGTMVLGGVALDMHGMNSDSDQFIFYGYNGDLSTGVSLDDIKSTGTVLGEGTYREQGKFVYLDKKYSTFRYVIVTTLSGGVMLGELRYDCFTPTLQPSFKPSFRPTTKPVFAPTITPTSSPTQCNLQYVFLIINSNPLPECQEHFDPGQTVTLCGFVANSMGNYVPARLWSNNDVPEIDAGMGLANVTDHAISSRSFIQLEKVTSLLDLAFDMHSTFGNTEYIFYASNTPGIPVTHKDAVVLLTGTQIGVFNYLPNGENGNPLDYKKYEYLFVTSGNSDKSVLLFEMRYRCSNPSIRPTPAPTLKPMFKPSVRPTLMPSQGECVSYSFDVPSLGSSVHSYSAYFPIGDLTVYGYTAGTKALLYSQSGGLGFEDTVAHEIAPGYAIYIEGLQSLEGVALSMQNVQGGDTWAWYGTDDFNSVDTPITFGSSDSGQFVSVVGGGKSWRDFKLIKVTALSGSVLLSGYQYCPPAKAV